VFGPGCLISLALGLLFTPLAAAATAGVAVSQAAWPRACSIPRGSRRFLGLAVLATIATDRTRALLGGRPVLSPGRGPQRRLLPGLRGGRRADPAAFAASFVVPAIRTRTRPAPGARPKNEAKNRRDRRN